MVTPERRHFPEHPHKRGPKTVPVGPSKGPKKQKPYKRTPPRKA
jgi:hypothetical protein